MTTLSTLSQEHWSKIGIRHHHGITVPLFSLHSKKSCGIGEFLDLIALIPWCRDLGFDIIQLLPIYDSGDDSSPYNAISAFALNPLHLSLAALPFIEEDQRLQEMLKPMQKLCATKRVQYDQLRPMREQFLDTYFSLFADRLMATDSFQSFFNRHRWVDAYCAFKALKKRFEGRPWKEWPKQYRKIDGKKFSEIARTDHMQMERYLLTQFLCYDQMLTVKEIAKRFEVSIMGDLPILLNDDSAEVWTHPHYFLPDLQAGVPPDYYCPEGQSWGFPLYNWDKLKKNDYDLWSTRLGAASEIYDMYRLDHAVGLFRMYGIPHGAKASEGRFIPDGEEDCINRGTEVLSMLLQASPMLPIAEDLGVVPQQIKDTLMTMCVPGMNVLRWSEPPYSPMSLSTVSTHDSELLREWWEQYPDDARRVAEKNGWEYTEILPKEHHFELLKKCHRSESFFHINLLSEYLALFDDLTYPKASHERINIPGKVVKSNWSIRYPVPIETIVTHDSLYEAMHQLARSV